MVKTYPYTGKTEEKGNICILHSIHYRCEEKVKKYISIKIVLAQEDCVLFIGSGISMWSGLPSWTGILNGLADFLEECGEDNSLVKREIANGDLLQAASYGFDRLTKPQIRTFMLRACRYGEAKPHEIHKKILALGVKCFITTNYDKLIEMGIGEWRKKEAFIAVTNRQLSEMGGIPTFYISGMYSPIFIREM